MFLFLSTNFLSTKHDVLVLCLCADVGPSSSQQQQPHKKLSKVEELMQKDLQAKQRQAASAAAAAAGGGGGSSSGRGGVNGSKGRVDHWLYEGIVVKVMSKALREQGYYKQKVGAGAHAGGRGLTVRRCGFVVP